MAVTSQGMPRCKALAVMHSSEESERLASAHRTGDIWSLKDVMKCTGNSPSCTSNKATTAPPKKISESIHIITDASNAFNCQNRPNASDSKRTMKGCLHLLSHSFQPWIKSLSNGSLHHTCLLQKSKARRRRRRRRRIKYPNDKWKWV